MYLLPGVRVFVFETQVLQLCLDGEQTQTVCQRRIDILCLSGYLVLFVLGLRAQRAHVVQSVGNLDKHNADVVADRQQQLAEVLRLLARLTTEYAAADFRQTGHYLRNLFAEQSLDVLHRIVGVLHYVMQQGRTDTRATQPDLSHANARDSYRMQYVGLAAQTTYAVMRLVCKIEGVRNQLTFLAVRGLRIVVQQRFKLALDQLVFGRCKVLFLHIRTQNDAQSYKNKMIYASARA